MSIEAMTQALEADRLIRGYVNSLVSNKPDEAAGFTKRMVDYVFATPPAAQRQPLTEDEVLRLWAGDVSRPVLGKNKVLAFARAIEAAHGIKGKA